MTRSIADTHNTLSVARGCALLVLAALALGGCETTGSGPGASAQAIGPPEPPMTHSRAAAECWMKTEKGAASGNLDKRADIVNKCIDEKMKAAAAAPKT